MSETRARCKGITKNANICKNFAMEGSDFCHWHQPKVGATKDSGAETPSQEQVLHLLAKHWPLVAAIIAGAVGDQVAADLWAYLKKQTRMESLVPPIRAAGKTHDVAAISDHYKRYHDYESLSKLVPLLRLGMKREEVEDLLGQGIEPDFSYEPPFVIDRVGLERLRRKTGSDKLPIEVTYTALHTDWELHRDIFFGFLLIYYTNGPHPSHWATYTGRVEGFHYVRPYTP